MAKIENYNSVEYRFIAAELAKTGAVEIEDQDFNLPFRFRPAEWQASSTLFKNCVFEQAFHLTDVNLQAGLAFENCRFDAGLQFYRCKGGYKGTSTFMQITNCQIAKGLTLQQCVFQERLIVDQQTTIDKLFITDSAVAKLHISESLVTGLFELNKTTYSDGIIFDRVQISGPLLLIDLSGDLHFKKSVINQPLMLTKIRASDIYFNQSNFLDTVQLDDCYVTGHLQLIESNFEKEVHVHSPGSAPLDRPVIGALEIRSSTFSGGLHVERIESWRGTDIGNMLIRCSSNLKGLLNFTKINFASATITGINTAGVSIAYCEISELQFHDLVNQGAINLISVQPMAKGDSLLDISRSVMGKTFLSNVDLQQYKQIKVDRSNLTELVTSAVHWFNPSQLIWDALPNLRPGRSLYKLTTSQAVGVMRYSTQKELYRQLKFAMEKQGDLLNRLRFKKEELHAYRRELSYWPFKRDQLGDRLILGLNRSNDYGFNWLKPVGLILLFTIIITPILAISANPDLSFWPDFTNTAKTWHYLSSTFYNGFTLLNPTHKVIELFDIRAFDKPSLFFYFVDFLDRLIVSYLLFQMIVAFRKYST